MFKHKQCNACINTISTTCQLKHIGYYIKFIRKKLAPYGDWQSTLHN